MYTFVGMIAAAAILVVAGTMADNNGKVIDSGHLVGLIVGFILLFLLSGIANGSVYKIIPTIWEEKAQSRTDLGAMEKVTWSRSMSGALIGLAGAAGGLGGVGINLVLRASYKSNQSATVAFWIFMAFYVLAAVITWWFYVRSRSVVSNETTDIVVEVPGTAPAADMSAGGAEAAVETAGQPKVSTSAGNGTLA